jgi:hypothetical protein
MEGNSGCVGRWIYLPNSPLSPKRQMELEKVFEGCTARKGNISAFPDKIPPLPSVGEDRGEGDSLGNRSLNRSQSSQYDLPR